MITILILRAIASLLPPLIFVFTMARADNRLWKAAMEEVKRSTLNQTTFPATDAFLAHSRRLRWGIAAVILIVVLLNVLINLTLPLIA